MKDAEDEAFDELAKRQGHWGGGYQAKRAMAADKFCDTHCVWTDHHPDCKMAADKQEPAQESWREFASDYERGFIDGMQKQAQSSVDKAVNRMAPPAQEPVAWAVQGCSKMWRGEFAEIDAKAEAKRIGGTCVAYALYTTLPKRPWAGLTDEEIQAYWDWEDWQTGAGRSTIFEMVRDIEAKLKRKNT